MMVIEELEFGATAEQVRQQLELRNIESRRVWKPMHLQPIFADCRVRQTGVAESLFKNGLCLPSGSAMTSNELLSVVDGVLDTYSEAQTPAVPQVCPLRPAG